ncbi:STAS domain-containing protein [Catellatospora sp. IY07-71]|uniref:STAS domain-containing protein n=1 Tax=Catellatospora sp. IY07-71 TaxID=2728827 RepID=UPI001BB2F31A|nr:STAS domain-containing protein [Catellatospora sp. IY07-71]
MVTLRAAGRLDLAGSVRLRTLMLKALAEAPGALLVDLGGVEVEDEVALMVIPAVCRQAEAWPGCRVVLYGASPPVGRALRALHMEEHFSICANEVQARAAAARPAGIGAWAQRFDPVSGAPADARHLLDWCCERWGVPDPVRAQARHVCSELVANAVLHARTTLELHLRGRTRHLHVAVRDFSVGAARIVARSGPPASGLAVVAALASGWGVTPTGDGKVVWATLSRRH